VHSYGVSIFRTALQSNSVVVHHVANLLIFGHLKNTFEVAADGHLVSLVRCGLGPESDSMLLLPHADYCPANLARLTKLFADHGEKQVQPAVVQGGGFLAFGEEKGPLATLRTLGILPLGLDALLKEMKISSHNQPTRGENVVVQAPEILDRVEGVHAAEGLSPSSLLLSTIGVVKPERPSVLQRVFLGKVRHMLAHLILTLYISRAMSTITAFAKACASHNITSAVLPSHRIPPILRGGAKVRSRCSCQNPDLTIRHTSLASLVYFRITFESIYFID